jgi:hypothetical protein
VGVSHVLHSNVADTTRAVDPRNAGWVCLTGAFHWIS